MIIFFIVSKKDEEKPILMSNLLHITGFQYKPNLLQSIELLVLLKLKFRINPITLFDFTEIALELWRVFLKNHDLSEIFLPNVEELSEFQENLLHFPKLYYLDFSNSSFTLLFLVIKRRLNTF